MIDLASLVAAHASLPVRRCADCGQVMFKTTGPGRWRQACATCRPAVDRQSASRARRRALPPAAHVSIVVPSALMAHVHRAARTNGVTTPAYVVGVLLRAVSGQ